MKEGDVIVEVDGHPIEDIDAMHRLLTEERLGVSVPVVVLRRELKLTFPVTPRELAPN